MIKGKLSTDRVQSFSDVYKSYLQVPALFFGVLNKLMMKNAIDSASTSAEARLGWMDGWMDLLGEVLKSLEDDVCKYLSKNTQKTYSSIVTTLISITFGPIKLKGYFLLCRR